MGLFGQKKPPRAVRKAESALTWAQKHKADTNANSREMRAAMQGTGRGSQAVNSGNAADRSAAKVVNRAQKDYNKALTKAAEKAAAKAAKKGR